MPNLIRVWRWATLARAEEEARWVLPKRRNSMLSTEEGQDWADEGLRGLALNGSGCRAARQSGEVGDVCDS
jgi:hypothetical protein